MKFNKQKLINTSIDLLEKAVYNVKNADRLTLWIVIGLLTLALLFQSASREPNIILNVPSENTIHSSDNDIVGHSFNRPSVLSDKIIDKKLIKNQQLEKSSSLTLNEDKIIPYGGFKYCYISKPSLSDNPFAQKETPTVTFVIDEARNHKGDLYVKTTIFSDYSADLVSTYNISWFKDEEKVQCTEDMIKNSTSDKLREKMFS